MPWCVSHASRRECGARGHTGPAWCPCSGSGIARRPASIRRRPHLPHLLVAAYHCGSEKERWGLPPAASPSRDIEAPRANRAMASSGVIRVLAIAVLLAAQLLGLSQCAACELGSCQSREACGCCQPAGPEAVSAGCPSCGSGTRAGPDAGTAASCCPSGDPHRAADDDAASRPCRCQLQPRNDTPIDRPHPPAGDESVGLPAPAVRAVVDDLLEHAADRLVVSDVPRRPARILLGVWRN
jgi:hypothetical protein